MAVVLAVLAALGGLAGLAGPASTGFAAGASEVPSTAVVPGRTWADPTEPYLARKAVAASWVEQVGSWSGTASEVAPVELRDTAPTATTTVLAAQSGDLEAESSTIVVLARQTLTEAGAGARIREIALTIELLLEPDGHWSVVPSAGQEDTRTAPPRSTSPPARAVLDDPRIDLPGPARADVEAGRVDDRLLGVLTEMARRHAIGVHVMSTGHRAGAGATTSAHSVGRAVDIRSVDGRAVGPKLVEETSELMNVARAAGASSSGPVLLDGARSSVIADHLHVEVQPSATPTG